MSERTNVGDKRQAILAGAYKVFHAHGYSAATVEQIAGEAGIAKGSVYNYFHSKEDIFWELFAGQIGTDEADFDRLLAEPISAVEKLGRYMDLWFASAAEYERIGALTLEFWAVAARDDGSERMGEMFRETYARWRGRIAGLVAQGIETGEFRPELDPTRAGAFIMAAMDGLTVHAIMGIGATIDESFLAAMKRGTILALSGGMSGDGAKEMTNGERTQE